MRSARRGRWQRAPGRAGAAFAALLLAAVLPAAAAFAVAGGNASTAAAGPRSEQYLFYRELRGVMQRARGAAAGDARRVFGGRAMDADAWGAVCALLDPAGAPHCSGAVVAPRWALTAAHCAGAAAASVRYWGGSARVERRLRHPQYAVRLADEGAGLDVVALQHDVALLRTQSPMALLAPPLEPPLAALRTHPPHALRHAELEVLGFGRAGRLAGAQLHGAECARAAWRGCVCARAHGAGVCAGDSGGPALLRGALVALASLGPLSCARPRGQPAAMSVLTPLQPYAAMIDATLAGRPGGFEPDVSDGATLPARAVPLLPALLLLAR